MRKHLIYNYFLLIIFLASANYGQEIKVPIDIQLELIPKIIAFDNNFNNRVGNENNIRIGIVYSNVVKSSHRIKGQIQDYINSRDNKIRNKTIDYEFITIESLEEYLANNSIYAVYFTPLRSVDIDKYLRLFRNKKILSFSSVEEFFREGLSIYFNLVDNKPQIVVNLDNSKREGVELSSQLLKISLVK